jgi:ABC-2 type transport system ATP-binding protein
MKQRLGIAYALLGDPDLMFLDEPTNGLDPAGVIEMRELIRSLGDGNRTVLLSSHLLHEVEQTCDSVTIISRGRLVAQGPVAQLVASGGREQVRLRTTDNTRAQPILAALDWVSDVAEQNGAVLVTAPIDRCGEMTAALAGSEVWVTEMTPVQTSLEDYFLEVTREDDPGSATSPNDGGATS